MRQTSPEHTTKFRRLSSPSKPFISFQALLFETFSGETSHFTRLATPYAPLSDPFSIARLCKEPVVSRIVRRDGGPAKGRRPYTQLSQQPTAGGNAQLKRPSSRPSRARCCCTSGLCFCGIWYDPLPLPFFLFNIYYVGLWGCSAPSLLMVLLISELQADPASFCQVPKAPFALLRGIYVIQSQPRVA